MAASTKHPLATWAPLIVACVFGCATETQGDGLLLNPVGDAGSGGAASAGTSSTDGGSSAGSMTTAGTFSEGGTSTGGGGSSSAGTFTSGGFSFGGTFSTAGTDAGGTGGASGGTGGASGGAGGKGGSGGSGGSAAGAGGKGGSGGTGGTGTAGTGGTSGGGTCKTGKLVPLAATDTGNAQYPASNAIDGDPTGTRWASEQGIDNEWLQLDMGEAVTVNRVVIVWENAYATDYKIQIADAAAGPFTDLYEDNAGNGGTDDLSTPTLKLGRGRYLRMQGVTRHLQAYGYSIYEMTAYGDTDETCK